MLLSKKIAVYLNLTECKLKQFVAKSLKHTHINLTPEQLLAMDMLWNEGAMSQQDLANAMKKDKNSIVPLVNALEKKKLLIRQRNPKDQRSNILVLTKEANDIKDIVKSKGINMLDIALNGINNAELQRFQSTLTKIYDNLSQFYSSKKVLSN